MTELSVNTSYATYKWCGLAKILKFSIVDKI